ncbi:hypothetical protein GCM10011571_27810 [Marinithermofilum abyssi]|uniref:Uncharacterized protein n=1 Tax=Marinithermofilum abyssi TaxID=1571185 RepID=A0A8J2Y9J0_9BACL|nr:hypothetical protein [Marinithermofilum abyssi]GGE24128.1 hypothetical protein GCM10011571_27810 [Marinithermofilum abyssi]
MDFLLSIITAQNWGWFVTAFFVLVVAVIAGMMMVTERIEKRQKAEFEQEFTGQWKAVSVEEE